MTKIQFRQLNKVYGGHNRFHAIKNIDLQIEEGEFTVFVGPSGCGKSTLLRMVAGLEDISGGDILFNDERVNDLTPKQRGIGMVFQSYALYPHMSVYENIAFGLKLSKEDTQSIEEKVRGVASILQLDHLLERKPKELSGGQRQRVAIGRAIVREPSVFLFDEPLSNLDAALRVQMRIEIAKLHSQLDVTMIYVTHDQVEAMTLADKIVVLNQGEISQVGSPLEIYNHPANVFVAGFIGSPKMNFLPVHITAANNQGCSIKLSSGTSIQLPKQVDSDRAGKGQLGIRPEHLQLEPEPDSFRLTGEVAVIEHLGNETLVYLQIPETDEPLVVSLAGEHRLSRNDTLTVYAPLQQCHLFDAQGKAFQSNRQAQVASLANVAER